MPRKKGSPLCGEGLESQQLAGLGSEGPYIFQYGLDLVG